MKNITCSVPAIHCANCVHTIEMEIGDLEGVTNVKANLDSKTVEIEFGAPASGDIIKGTLKEIGYPPDNS